MSDTPSILIVDDHQPTRDGLSAYLARFGFCVEAVKNGDMMRQRLNHRTFSLILLEIMLPGENGLSLCRIASEQMGIPVIILTSAGEPADRVAGLEIGADDYVLKPFDARELVARIRCVLRRRGAQAQRDPIAGSAMPAYPSIYTFSGWTLNVSNRDLHNPDNIEINLSTAEFHLLRALVENPNRVLSRQQLLDLTQKHDNCTFDRSIDSQISRLRKKLESNPRRPQLIKTIRGDGYMFASTVSTSKTYDDTTSFRRR